MAFYELSIASNSVSIWTLSHAGNFWTIFLSLFLIISLGCCSCWISSSLRLTAEWFQCVLFKERTRGELTMSFNRTNFEGLHEALPMADCWVLKNAFVIVVAFEVVTFSFSEHRVLLDKHVPIFTIFFLRVKFELTGLILVQSSPTYCLFYKAVGLFNWETFCTWEVKFCPVNFTWY